MIKPLTRPGAPSTRGRAAFAETRFMQSAADEDDGAFAPTRLFDQDEASTPPTDAGSPGASAWATARWVAKQEARAHAAADSARTVIAAQRQAGLRAAAPRSRLARLRAVLGRLLPDVDSLIPLFIGVAVTMALISAVLPLFDKP